MVNDQDDITESGNFESVPGDESESAFASQPVAPEKKKGVFNLVLLGVAVIFVGIVAFVGWNMISGDSQSAPAASPSPTLTPPKEQPAPIQPDAVSTTPPVASPDLDASTQPLAPVDAGLDPMTGLPVAASDSPAGPPLAGLDLPDSSAVPPVVDSTVNGIDPATGLPVAPVVPDAPLQPDPALSPPVVDQPVVDQPAIDQPVVSPPAAEQPESVVTPDPVLTGASASLDQTRNMIMSALDRLQQSLQESDRRQGERAERIEQRLDETSSGLKENTSRLDAFERRLVAIEKGESRPASKPKAESKPKPKPSAQAKPVRKSVAKARSKPPVRRAAPKPAQPVNRIEIISRADQPAPVVIASKPTTTSTAKDCRISSIQPGRFWVRLADGSFATYGVDDRIDGGRVTKVDPDEGIFVNDRRWSCGR